MIEMRELPLLVLMAAVLAGCGYKAPLYLPQTKPETAQKRGEPALPDPVPDRPVPAEAAPAAK
jgi:predicted small lipoprotein YifL